MPRYMVERTFPRGLHIPVSADGAQTCLGVVGRNADLGVTRVHSYVSDDKRARFAFMTVRTRSQSAQQPSATDCRSIRSRVSAC